MSTPRHAYFNHPSPRTNDNHTIPPVSHYTNRPLPAHSNGGSPHDIMQMFLTHLAENRTQADKGDHKKDLLANISSFDGKDKKQCLMWMNQLVQTVTHSPIPLRELLVAKAGPIVMSVVQSFLFNEPEATDEQVRKLILKHFSNVGTQQEAYHHLKRMKQADDESLIAYNTEYVAVHEGSYNVDPENQMIQTVIANYVNTLSEYTSNKLIKKIFRNDMTICTLRHTIDNAVQIYKQARQEEMTKMERSALRETTISEDTTINECSLQEEVNFMPPGRQPLQQLHKKQWREME